MNSDQRWIADAFLRELKGWRVSDISPPLYLVDRRMTLAGLVLAEIGPDDLECLALRGVASAAQDLCLSPASLSAARRYVAARWAWLGILWNAVK